MSRAIEPQALCEPTVSTAAARTLSAELSAGTRATADRSPAEPGLDQPVEPGLDPEGARADEHWMTLALDAARRAQAQDEVPIGAIVVLDGRVVATAHNETRSRRDPTAHAELLAISAAARAEGAMRLPGAVVYTTVEPCFMCAGALSHARVARVVWAVRDPKFGGCVSLGRVLDDPRLNHQVDHAEGVGAGAARDLLQSFFRKKRGLRA